MRKELNVSVTTEAEMRKYYEVIWQPKNMQDMIIIKALLYTGIRVSELIRLTVEDIDFDRCQMRIVAGKGKKDRIVPFPKSFREPLAMHLSNANKNKQISLFESS